MIVDVPSVGQVEFPDSMSDADVSAAIKTKILPQQAKAQPLPTPGLLGQIGQAAVGTLFAPKEQVLQALSANPTDIKIGGRPLIGFTPEQTTNNVNAIDRQDKELWNALNRYAYEGLKYINPLNIGTGPIAKEALAAKGALGTGVNALARAAGLVYGTKGAAENLGERLSNVPQTPQQKAALNLGALANAAMAGASVLPGAKTPPLLTPQDFFKRPGEAGYAPQANDVSQRLIQQSRSQAPPKPATPAVPSVNGPITSPSPAARVFQAVDYSPEDLVRYNELNAKMKPTSREQFTSPEYAENWRQFEQLRNKYGVMPPKQLTKGAQNAINEKQVEGGVQPQRQGGNERGQATETSGGYSVQSKAKSGQQGTASTPGGPLQEEGVREQGRGNARESGGKGDEGLLLAVGTPVKGQVGRVGGRLPVRLRRTAELLNDLGVKPWLGKDKNYNIPFSKLALEQLYNKYDEAKARYQQIKTKEHPDLVPPEQRAAAHERFVQATQVWDELQNRFKKLGVLEKTPVETGVKLAEKKELKALNNWRQGLSQKELASPSPETIGKLQRISELQGKSLLKRPVSNPNKTSGESGFVIVPPSFWDKVGFNHSTKIDPQQMLSRVRNMLGENSESFKWLQGVGLQQFLSEKRTPDELKQWAEENSPKVEVRKFGAVNQDDKTKRLMEITHLVDTKFKHYTINGAAAGDVIMGDEGVVVPPEDIPDKELRGLMIEYRDLQRARDLSTLGHSHWQSIAPKSEQDMPGYVEIAVVKPFNKFIEGDKFAMYNLSKDTGVQFPSSHNFPPNTLGFVRGYMEALPNGKKVFHVIEVQSDWAQELRRLESPESDYGDNMVSVNRKLKIMQTRDPLLPHYERLVLKAAIDHARSEGADAIAISDAETAMMTEGHDRVEPQRNTFRIRLDNEPIWEGSYENYASALPRFQSQYGVDRIKSEKVPETERNISQEPGMRLHYDQTLPRIAGELTGEKGERVGFGQHKMAYDEISHHGTEREDLIFRNPSGEPKTDITARMFNIGRANPENFTFFGKDKLPIEVSGRAGEKGFIINVTQEFLEKVQDLVKNGADDLKAWLEESGKPMAKEFTERLAGNALPRTTSINKEVSSKMYNYAQANAVSEAMAKNEPDLVLATKDPAFDKKLGGTLVEYNLRATGNTSIGKKWSPFKTDADYQTALKEPEIQDAINRHADIVLKDAEQRHEELGGSKIDLPDKRMFVNLKFLPQAEISGKLKAGNLKATLQGKTRFGQERKGTAEEYETSYKKIAERMIRANYAEYQRKLLNDEIVKQGLGEMVAPGDKIPANSVEIPVKLQRAVLIKEGESPSIVNQSKSLYIDKRIAPEYTQAMQANSPLTLTGLRRLADVLTKVQVSLGVDAGQHIVNMLSAVEGVVRAQAGRNLVGVKEVDTTIRIGKNLINAYRNDPATQQLLRDMAKEYGIAREEHTYKGVLGGTPFTGKVVRLVDKAGRMTLFQIAKELGDAGLMSKDPVEIRNFVNKHLGQYNQRLMSTFTALAKSTFSPFIVAGKTFNRLAISRFLLSPQVKAANPQAWATMRARQALYLGTALVVVPAILNQKFNGTPFPEDTKIGEIKFPDGKILDVARFMFFRRGERITGAQAVIEGQVMPRLRGEQPEALGQTAKEAFTDVARGAAAPYAGPLPNMASALLRGKTALNYPAAQAGEQYPYWQAALRQANPLLGAGLTDQPRTGIEQRGQSMFGLRDSNPRAIVGRLRNQFLYKIGKANQPDSTPSQYVPLIQSLQNGDMDSAKKEYDALLQQHLQLHQFDKNSEYEAKMDLKKEFERYAKSHGNSSEDQEKAFFKTLSPHQQDLYQKALDEQKDIAAKFLQIPGAQVPKKSRVPHFEHF
jgi:hypothetical protein